MLFSALVEPKVGSLVSFLSFLFLNVIGSFGLERQTGRF